MTLWAKLDGTVNERYAKVSDQKTAFSPQSKIPFNAVEVQGLRGQLLRQLSGTGLRSSFCVGDRY